MEQLRAATTGQGVLWRGLSFNSRDKENMRTNLVKFLDVDISHAQRSLERRQAIQ